MGIWFPSVIGLRRGAESWRWRVCARRGMWLRDLPNFAPSRNLPIQPTIQPSTVCINSAAMSRISKDSLMTLKTISVRLTIYGPPCVTRLESVPIRLRNKSLYMSAGVQLVVYSTPLHANAKLYQLGQPNQHELVFLSLIFCLNFT